MITRFEVTSIFDLIKTYANVANCEDVTKTAEALKSLGIEPRTAFDHTASFYTVYRESNSEKYLYVMNAGDDTDTVRFSIKGVFSPYLIDRWTGNVKAINAYHHVDGRTEITLSIAEGDAKLIPLEEYTGTLHCISYNTGITSEMIALSSNQYSLMLSDGTSRE